MDSESKMNEATYQNRNGVIDTEKKTNVYQRAGEERGKKQMKEIKRYKLTVAK